MAKNPNASLSNRNTLYVGRSGGGKTQALKQNPEIPKQGVPVMLYDPNLDHKATQYQDFAKFGRAALAALNSGRGFRIAYTGGSCERDHERFCEFVFAVLDGNRLTYVIDEELGGSGQRTASAAPHHAKLMNQGRKFGLIYHGVVQFAQEVPKTVYRNCEIKYVGPLESDAAKKLAVEIDVPWQQISGQQPLQFWVKDPNFGFKARQIQLQYKNV